MFIPASKDLNFKIIKINNFNDLQEYFLINKKYLYYEYDDNKYIIQAVKDMEKNYQMVTYRNFFQKLGLKGVKDWKNMTDEDIRNDKIKITNTINTLFK